jgi:hypothetical protein
MAIDKTALGNGRWKNVLTVSGLNSKSITGVEVYQHGSVEVVEISYSGGSQFLKLRQGLCEIGGTAEWNTGTQV